MNYLNFTAEEAALIAIYHDATCAATLMRIAEAVPYMDTDMRGIAEMAAGKLCGMTDDEFDGVMWGDAESEV